MASWILIVLSVHFYSIAPKALKMPTEDTKEEQVEHQPQEKLEALKSEIKTLQEQLNEQATIEPQEAPRKWWKFWK